jgi:hypothetical protein
MKWPVKLFYWLFSWQPLMKNEKNQSPIKFLSKPFLSPFWVEKMEFDGY